MNKDKQPKDGEFRCEMCQGIFGIAWSPEEATAEAEEHGLDIEECGMVCDPCYKKTPWGQPGMTPEISTKIQQYHHSALQGNADPGLSGLFTEKKEEEK